MTDSRLGTVAPLTWTPPTWEDPEEVYLRCMAAVLPRARWRRPSTWLGRTRYLWLPGAVNPLAAAAEAARQLAAGYTAAGRYRAAHRWRRRAQRAEAMAEGAGWALVSLAAMEPWVYSAALVARRSAEPLRWSAPADRQPPAP